MEGPLIRLLRLWLAGVPLVMFGVAVFFAVIAVAEARWGLLAVMLLLAALAVALWFGQAWVLGRYANRVRKTGGGHDQ